MEFETANETGKTSGRSSNPSNMTLQTAIDLGEYDPDYLANFPEWHNLGRHAQLQLIRQAFENREYQLVAQWAEINNLLDFSQKPHLQKALKNIEKQRHLLASEKERIYLEYSNF